MVLQCDFKTFDGTDSMQRNNVASVALHENILRQDFPDCRKGLIYLCDGSILKVDLQFFIDYFNIGNIPDMKGYRLGGRINYNGLRSQMTDCTV